MQRLAVHFICSNYQRIGSDSVSLEEYTCELRLRFLFKIMSGHTKSQIYIYNL